MTSKFDEWPWKTIGQLFYATSSIVYHFFANGEFKLESQSGNAQFGSISTIGRAGWPWNLMDDLEKKVPLINIIELFASFHNHMWVRTGVTVRKRLSWVLTSVTLAFDLWPWTFAWTSLWSLVMTPENDGNIVKKLWRTDRRTESTIHRAAWPQLKTNWIYNTCLALYFSIPCFFLNGPRKHCILHYFQWLPWINSQYAPWKLRPMHWVTSCGQRILKSVYDFAVSLCRIQYKIWASTSNPPSLCIPKFRNSDVLLSYPTI